MRRDKNALYEQIMMNVAKQVKMTLNEDIDNEVDEDAINAWIEEVDLFSYVWNAIGDEMTWDDWKCMGSSDRADFLYDALTELRSELGELPYTEEDLYDAYYQWANSLEATDFASDEDYLLTEEDNDYLMEAFGDEDELDIVEATGEPFMIPNFPNTIRIIRIDSDLNITYTINNGEPQEGELADVIYDPDDIEELYEIISENC